MARNTASSPRLEPEVESVTSQLLHPILQDPKFLAAALGLILAVSFFTFLRPGRKASSRRAGPATVLLLGPSDAGKTSIFANITQNTYPQTHTSVVPSSTTVSLSDPDHASAPPTTIKLVDLPGHPRLRDEVTKQLKEATAIIFVVDVVSIVRNASTVAEELPKILTALAATASRSRDPSHASRLLFLAHKSDLLIKPSPPNTLSPPDIPGEIRDIATQRIQKIITREMERLKSTRSSSGGRIEGIGRVSSSGGSWWKRLFGTAGAVSAEGEGDADVEDEGLIWGVSGKEFSWDDVEGVDISWGASGLGVVNNGKVSKVVAEVGAGNGLDDVKKILRLAGRYPVK